MKTHLSSPTNKAIRKKLSKHHKLHDFSYSLFNLYCSLTGFLHVLPDFYIIGAAKCGTSSLAEYLDQHPNIYSATTKEIRYFGKYYHRGINWYRVNFPFKFHKYFIKNFLKKKFLTGDSTPRYIDNPHVPKRIKQITPNAKFIVLLRNPIDRAFSHYNMMLNLGYENLSFEEAIDCENKRSLKEFEKMKLDQNYYNDEYFRFGYLHRGIYVDKLKFWFDIFPKNQFLIIQSEKFFEDPSKFYNKVLQFLDLPTFKLKKYPGIGEGNYKKRKMETSTKKKLSEYFKPHNERLYEFLNEKYDWN